MKDFTYLIVALLLVFWITGFLILELGSFIHVVFIIALAIIIFKIFREHNQF